MPKHRPRRKSTRSAVRRTAAALAGGALVVLPTLTTGLPTPVVVADAGNRNVLPARAPAAANGTHVPDQPAPPLRRRNIVVPPIAVDGSLPRPPLPEPLVVPGG